jgi:hypothetical protein
MRRQRIEMVVAKELIAHISGCADGMDASVTGAGPRTPSYGPDNTPAPLDAIILKFLGNGSLTPFHMPSGASKVRKARFR